MTTNVTENTYYNYADYSYFKNTFESYDSKLSETIVIEESSIPPKIEAKNKVTFTKQLKEIKKYLEQFTANDLEKNGKCCGYLNYWISNHVSKTYKDQKDLFFTYFSKFIENINGTPKSNTCISKIHLINDELLKKMGKLYDLYDYYENNHLLLSRGHGNSYVCTQFEGLVNDYNEAIKKYKEKGDVHLLKKLKDVICLIKHDKWMSENDCKTKVIQLFSQESESLYDKNSCKNLERDLLKFTDLIVDENHTDQETSSVVTRDSGRTPESGSHHMRRENPDSEGAHELNVGVSPSMDDTSVGKTSRYIINTALPLLGASSFTFLLYKVTPAGAFVNKFFGRNKSAYRNMDNIKKNALSNYNYEYEERDPLIETMNISYNTLSNT
ncbi:unnamed protein product [Plasmodium vivax]|uniref:(malaria parasite P. vivax) hypothetical protein n=1 Tax=Plasmodium vivax TaxID=5855 RepID=A0A8S4H909_PLAVI|nr:unnamed protein product [Plasmodium vivax]